MSSPFHTPNPHALAAILEAAETRSIIAATDIFDSQGIKLWAARQPVSAELQRKLADRHLRDPLESSLIAQDGVDLAQLREAMVALAEGNSALAPLVRPHLPRLEREIGQLTLHPTVQLLLTAAEHGRSASYHHAIAAMSVNGALAAAAGGDAPELRSAMLAGLLHDLGEIYLSPRHGEAEADREMDFESYQQLVVHPHVGFLIIKQLTNYPQSIAQAVAEHHEHLDGSGYPKALSDRQISPQGRLLSVTEALLNALRDPGAPLLHASVALRAVPGEFDPSWAGLVSQAANAQPLASAVMDPGDIRSRREALEALLAGAQARVADLAREGGPPAMLQAVSLAEYLLQRVRTGWNESGLWGTSEPGPQEAAEVEAMEDELYRRLRGVQRATLLRAGELEHEDAVRLQQFCDTLAMDG